MNENYIPTEEEIIQAQKLHKILNDAIEFIIKYPKVDPDKCLVAFLKTYNYKKDFEELINS